MARADFVYPLPPGLSDLDAAPLLCAGIIGFRSLRVAGVEPGERVGLFGFGASAHLAIAVLQAWNCEVYVATRGAGHRALAESLGATWVGAEQDRPPAALDRAVTFAPIGRRGGGGASEPPQRRRGSHQRDSSRPHSAV